jgi:L-iditol 2-dehydrogenase
MTKGSSMQALVKKGKGEGNLGIGEVAVPTPGNKDVLIRVKAGAICGSDLHIMHGRIPCSIPVVIGHEFSGVIEEVGRGVKGWKRGDRVIAEGTMETCGSCFLCKVGNSHVCRDRKYLGVMVDGCFAEYVKIPAGLLHRMPEGMSFEEASLAEPASIVIHALIEDNRIEVGDFVAVLGCGSIGLLGAQVAKAVGAEKVMVTGIEADVPVRLKGAEELGVCDYVVNAEKDDPVKVVREATGGEGADIVLDTTGSSRALEQGFQMVRRKGVIAALGYGEDTIEVPWSRMIREALRIQSCLGSTSASFEKFRSLASQGRLQLKPLITEEYPLREWEKAFRSMERRESVKALLIP